MSELKIRFDKAAADSKALPYKPDTGTLLKIYALYKQASAGDASGKRPGFMDVAGRAKWDAWDALKGMPQEEAMRRHIDLIEELTAGAPQGRRETAAIDHAAAAPAPAPTPAVEGNVPRAVDAERRAFLDAAFERHLGPESRGDLAGIVASYATDGHLNFNGAVYDTPQRLLHFHRALGFDGQGLLDNLGGTISRINYTHDSVIVEYVMSGTVTAELAGSPAGRPVSFPVCGVYEFDEDGALASERIYMDTGNWLAQPIFRP